MIRRYNKKSLSISTIIAVTFIMFNLFNLKSANAEVKVISTNAHQNDYLYDKFCQINNFSFFLDARIPAEEVIDVNVVTYDLSTNFMDSSYVYINDSKGNTVFKQYFDGKDDYGNVITNVNYNPDGWTLICKYGYAEVWLYKHEKVEVWGTVSGDYGMHGCAGLQSR